ncbi:MAG: sulfite exporter TauE/SafE family protein [Bacteroidales bacterium]|nr:sulfite exporter TauE/SafE family protein [Bacteroidales bacterium]MBN2698971.1 sulfite exporter TauE/SafE family protein [Bacteroidales bacterium]
MEWYFYPAVVAVGVVAGIINTLSAAGSMLVLPFLMAFGLDPNMANGTNRIAILLQNVVGVSSFHREKVLDLRQGIKVGLPAAAGAIAGAFIAVSFNEAAMKKAIAILLLLMFLLVLLKPNRWVTSHEIHPALPYWLQVIIFFLIGMYGGFIQGGVGFFLLTGLVLGCGFELVKANAMKLFIILLYTPVALLIFFLNGHVNLWIGLLLSAGSMIGAWLGARMAIKWGAKLIRYFVLVALLGSAIYLIMDNL